MKKIILIAIAAMMAFASAQTVSAAETDNVETQAPKKKGKDIRTVVLDSPKVHCANCAKKVEENISFEKGVKALKVSHKDKTIEITFDANKTSLETLLEALRKLGFPSTLVR